MNAVRLLILTASLGALLSCNNKITMGVNTKNSLVWNYSSPVVRAGETIPFAFSNGSSSYTTDANGLGVFNPLTLEYTAPATQVPLRHTISAQDSSGLSGSMSVRIAGFQSGLKIDFPLSYGDENFPTGSAIADNGTIYVSSFISDSPGWQRSILFKSTDGGLNFTMADHYAPFEMGESYPLGGIHTNGDDVYACGMAYNNDMPREDGLWIRKSSDNGATWSTVFSIYTPGGSGSYCYDMAVSGAGNVYAVGHDPTNGLIYESTDDGASWNTILAQPGVEFYSVKVSPLGVVWAVAKNGDVYKGTFAAGWTFSLVGNLGANKLYYWTGGKLLILSETEAVYSFINGADHWLINRTTDGGATWVTVNDAGFDSRGREVIKLASGTLLAHGTSLSTSPDTGIVLKSTDNGATWASAYSSNTPSRWGVAVVEANDGSFVRAFGYYNYLFNNQIYNIVSTDDGATWSSGNDVIYKENMYQYIYDFVMDGLGNYFSSTYSYMIDNTKRDPWMVVKSSDAGVSWTSTDVYTDPANHLQAECLTVGPANEVYGIGSSGASNIVRKTSNNGSSWAQVDTSAVGCKFATVATNGDVFYSNDGVNAPIRKGATNGSVWSTIAPALPTGPGMTIWLPLDIQAMPDGSLWISGLENNGAALYHHVIYRSTDAGVSFTEILREVGSISYQDLIFKNGILYAITVGGVKKTSNYGVSWVDVYDNSLGAARDLAVDYSDRVYIMLSDMSSIVGINQFTGTPFLMFDYSVFNTLSGEYLFRLEACATTSGVCAITHYDVSKFGTVHEILPLIIP